MSFEDHLSNLHKELLVTIAMYLPADSVLSLCCTCKSISRAISSADSLWQQLTIDWYHCVENAAEDQIAWRLDLQEDLMEEEEKNDNHHHSEEQDEKQKRSRRQKLSKLS